MRFAPPNRLRIADRASGLNQISVGSYNERLILSLLLQNQGISRMEIGQKTGLSAQTVSVIVRSLEQEGLVAKGEARRGRVGPPTIPMSLNPEGAFSVGISIGYRKTDIVLIDFVGETRFHTAILHSDYEPKALYEHCLETVQTAIRSLSLKLQRRITGIGIVLPADDPIDDSEKTLSESSPQSLNGIQNELESLIGLPVFVQNDITATAGGESMFGVAKTLSDYLFFFLGSRLHSRLILNHQIYNGNNNISANNADVGILNLEQILLEADLSTNELWEGNAEWPDYGEPMITWQINCVEKLQQTVTSLAQFVDVKTVVLSANIPETICQTICQNLENELTDINALSSAITTAPKAIGAASLPFISRFMVQ